MLTRKALTNNSFNSIADLADTIDIWAQNWNEPCGSPHLRAPEPSLYRAVLANALQD